MKDDRGALRAYYSNIPLTTAIFRNSKSKIMKASSYHTAAVVWMACLLPLLFQHPSSTTTTANILKRLPKCGEDQCHCTGAVDGCPALPFIDSGFVNNYRTLTHANPMIIQCDPFASTNCVRNLTVGEACIVELIAPEDGTGTCPDDYSYQ